MICSSTGVHVLDVRWNLTPLGNSSLFCLPKRAYTMRKQTLLPRSGGSLLPADRPKCRHPGGSITASKRIYTYIQVLRFPPNPTGCHYVEAMVLRKIFVLV